MYATSEITSKVALWPQHVWTHTCTCTCILTWSYTSMNIYIHDDRHMERNVLTLSEVIQFNKSSPPVGIKIVILNSFLILWWAVDLVASMCSPWSIREAEGHFIGLLPIIIYLIFCSFFLPCLHWPSLFSSDTQWRCSEPPFVWLWVWGMWIRKR